MARLRIAMANIQSCIGTTRGYWQYLTTAWKYRLPHDSDMLEPAARFLREEGVDLAGLCEVEEASLRSRGVDQLARLAELAQLPERRFFLTVEHGRRVRQGNAVCGRFPITGITDHRLPGLGEPRHLCEARIEVEGRPLRFFITHLSLERACRDAQIKRIAEIIHASSEPTILAGDFNIDTHTELELLFASDLRQSLSAPSFPSWKPVRHLDHLFFSGHFEVLGQHTFSRFRFSDHLPLVADVAFA